MDRADAIKVLGAALGLGALDVGRAAAHPVFQRAGGAREVNVRDVGAAGDGRTDDTDAFERGAAALAAAGGGVLTVPPGTFLVRDLWLRSNTWLRGAGPGRSVLRRPDASISSLGPATNVVNAGPSRGAGYSVGDRARDVWVTDVEVDGNANGQDGSWDGRQSGDGVGGAAVDLRYVANVVLERVYAHHAITEGVRLWMCPGAQVRGCHAAYNGTQSRYSGRGNGFNVQGDAADATNPDARRFVTLVQCESDHNGDEGFEADLVSDLAFIGCSSHHNGWSAASGSSAYGFELTGGAAGSPPYPTRVMVLGCFAEQNVRAGSSRNAGLQVNTLSPLQHLIIDDFIVMGQTGRAIGVDFQGGAGHVTLHNIHVDGWGGPGSSDHAVLVQAGAGTRLRGVVLSNISIRGGGGGTGNGVTLLTKGSPAGSFEGLSVHDCVVDGAGGSGLALWGNFSGFTIRSCAVTACQGHGIYLFPNGEGNALTDGLVDGCVAIGNVGAGVLLGALDAGAGTADRIRISNAVLRRNGYGAFVSPVAGTAEIADVNLGENAHADVVDRGRSTSVSAGRRTQLFGAGPAVQCDALAGEDVEVGPLSSPVRILAPTNALKGLRLRFHVRQDGSGGRGVAWDPVFRIAWSDAGNGPNRSASVDVRYDGNRWVQVGAQSPWL